MFSAWSTALQFCLIIFLLLSANSANATTQTDFKQAVELFEAEEYLKAVKIFEHIHKQGNNSIAIYYNLASTYYKLNNFSKSRLYFNKLRKLTEMKSLAEYNLGLISLKLEEETKANSYFRSVINDNRDSKLVYLAQAQINKKHPDYKAITVYTSIKLGYDDNINITPVETVLDKADSFSELFLSADYLIKGHRKSGWIGNVLFYRFSYSDSDTYDQDQYGIGIKKTIRYRKLDTHLRTNFKKLTYGKDDYLSNINLEAQVKYNLSNNRKVYFKYRYTDINSDNSLYDYLKGWQQRFKTEYRLYNKDSILKVYYEFEKNDRLDLVTTSGNQFSYSPDRHAIRINHRRILNNLWSLNGDISFRKSDYPRTPTQNRNDERWKLSTYADYRISKSIKSSFKVEYTDNNSNDSFYDYHQTVLSTDVSMYF